MSATKEGSTVGRLKFTVTTKTSVNPIDEAQAAVAGLKTPGVMQKVDNVVKFGGDLQDTVTGDSDRFQAIETIMSPLVENLKIFTDLVTRLSEVSVSGCLDVCS